MRLDAAARKSLKWLLALDGFLVSLALLAFVSGEVFIGSLFLVVGAGISVSWLAVTEKRQEEERQALVNEEERRKKALARKAAQQAAQDERELAEKRDAMFRFAGLDDLDTMTQVQFRNWVAAVLRGAGYAVEPVTDKGEIGVDLVGELDGVRIAVQCKRQDQPVGAGAVEQVAKAASELGCARSMVACSTTFTPGAQELAKAHGCILANRTALEELVRDPHGTAEAKG